MSFYVYVMFDSTAAKLHKDICNFIKNIYDLAHNSYFFWGFM